MVIAELYKVFKSWKSRIVIILAALLGILHTIDSIFYTGTDKKSLNPYHPAFASFLNGISANGKYRTYFLWIMPIFLIFAYCDRYVSEKKKNMDIIYCSKIEKKQYFISKLATAGIVAVIINLIPNIISIIMTSIFLHGKNGFMDVEKWSLKDVGTFNYWCIHHAYAAYAVFLLSNVIVMALLAIICQSIIFIIEDAKLAMLIVTAIWMGVYFGNNYFFIGFILQPFIDESSLTSFVVHWLRYIPLVIVCVLPAYFKVVKKSERL